MENAWKRKIVIYDLLRGCDLRATSMGEEDLCHVVVDLRRRSVSSFFSLSRCNLQICNSSGVGKKIEKLQNYLVLLIFRYTSKIRNEQRVEGCKKIFFLKGEKKGREESASCRIALFFRPVERKLLPIRKKFTFSEGKKGSSRRVLLTIYGECCAREEFTSNVRACVQHVQLFSPVMH